MPKYEVVKSYATRFLKSVAVFFLLFPVLYIVLAGTLFNIPFNTCIGILLSPFYYFVSFLVVATGYGLWEMKRWSWNLLILSQILVTYQNAVFVQGYAETHHQAFAFLLSVLIQAVLVRRISTEIRVPYFFPKIRWWESNPTYRLSVPVYFAQEDGVTLKGEILDISVRGCFIKFHQNLSLDEKVSMRFQIYEYLMQCEGTIVWLAQSAVTHPRGIGIKFGPLTKNQKRTFKLVDKKLKTLNSFYRRYRYWMSPEEFHKEYLEVEASGLRSLRARKKAEKAEKSKKVASEGEGGNKDPVKNTDR